MSEPAPAPAAAPAEVNDYLQVWIDNLAAVLAQVANAPFPMQSLAAPPTETPPAEEQDLSIIVTASGAIRGEMSLRVPHVAVLGLGQLFMGEAQDPKAELKPDHRDAVQELVRQVAGQTATALADRWGEVQLRAEGTAPPTWSAGATGWLGSTAEAPYRFVMQWQLSAALVAALRPSPEPAPAPPPIAMEPSAPAAKKDRLEFLMDVELGVSLRFGGKRMLLREVLELDAGSVVELDRHIQEPADLFLDGKLIARGEVVVVDGSYGLRVLEVMSSPPAD